MVTIRDAGPDDSEALARVRALSWRSAYDGLLAPELIATATGPGGADRQRAFLADDPARRALLAEHDGEAVGMAVYGPDREVAGAEHAVAGVEPDARTAELYVIYVLPRYWSRGVGRPLMDRVLDDVRAGGYARLALWVLAANDRARRFYERYGFAVTDKTIAERHGHVTYDIRYEREVR
ncbi:MAG: GNAT family N-acetyltransferase [Actinoallomurus sp.]